MFCLRSGTLLVSNQILARVLNTEKSLWTSSANHSIIGGLSSVVVRVTVAVLSSLLAISDCYCIASLLTCNYWPCRDGCKVL